VQQLACTNDALVMERQQLKESVNQMEARLANLISDNIKLSARVISATESGLRGAADHLDAPDAAHAFQVSPLSHQVRPAHRGRRHRCLKGHGSTSARGRRPGGRPPGPPPSAAAVCSAGHLT
jgi:hypothetical protein